MAREMNVIKRIDALRNIVAKTSAHSAKAKKIADELANSFDGDKSTEGKQALKTAQLAKKLSAALDKAAGAVSP